MSILKKIIDARQASANRKVAALLQASEFKDETFEYVLGLVESGTVYGKL